MAFGPGRTERTAGTPDRRSPAEDAPLLILRFALFTAIALAAAAAGVLLLVRHFATAQSERAAAQHVRFVSDSVIRGELTALDFQDPANAERRRELDELFRRQVLVDGALLAELVRRDGTIVYSNDHSLIGTRTPDLAHLTETLSGTLVSDVTTLPPGRGVAEETKVLRALAPVPFGRGGDAGALVLYQDYAPIAQAAEQAFFPIAGVFEIVLVVLFVSLVPALRRVTSRIRSQMREIEYRALHDELTDLPNRVLFSDRIEQAVQRARRDGAGVAVLLVDLDRFKEINDALGHRWGDVVLQELAQRLRTTLRESDTLARLSGDEFGVVAPDITPEGVPGLVDRVMAALAEPFQIQDLPLDVAASVGVALYPAHGNDGETLVRHADVAVYVAKEARAGFAVYDSERDENDPEKLALVGGLRRAVTEGELVLHYQPKADLRTGEVVGVEALVRWQHPELGLLYPDRFVPLAERTGLIKPLSRYVLETALEQARAWSEDGVDLRVAVNMTMYDLLDLGLPLEVEALLARTGIEPHRLELEITESTIMADPERVREVLGALSQLGVGLAIDDFGTGYSSLAYLKSLPVHQLKIDKVFVMNLTRDPSDAAIVRSTIDLARNLGLRVVAEGVDAGDVWRELEELGCDYVQGYYLSRPVEAERVRRLVTGLFGQARPLPAAPTPALVSRPHLVLVEASPDGPAGAPPRPWPTVGEPSP